MNYFVAITTLTPAILIPPNNPAPVIGNVRIKSKATVCKDTDTRCAAFVKTNHCDANRHYMEAKCAKACGFCKVVVVDGHWTAWQQSSKCSIRLSNI